MLLKYKGKLINAVAGPVTAAAYHLKYSDWCQIFAIVFGLIGTSSFVLGLSTTYVSGRDITGFAVLLTTIFAAVGQYLQSKGD